MERFVEETAAEIDAERARGTAPEGPPARDLGGRPELDERAGPALRLRREEPGLAADDVVEVLLTVWLRTIYGGRLP